MKKYFIKLGIFFIIFVFLLSNHLVKASLPLSGKTIVLDSGHGGIDPGTLYKDIYEKDINLAISKALESELVSLGAQVILTRDGDYDLSSPKAYRRKKSDFDNRIRIINDSRVSFYISIHLNFLNDANYHGPQVFYNFQNDKNKEIAQILQDSLNKELKSNREIKKIPSSTYMYSKLKTAGVLIECGFLSNAYERNLLVKEEYQKKIAKVIANALKELHF